MRICGGIWALCELGRIGNALTAGSGPAAAAVLCGLPLSVVLRLFFCGFCAYVGGVALNDFLDRKEDAIRRPERPIPRGAVSPKTAALFAFANLAASPIIALSVSYKVALWFVLVCLLAVGYDVLKRILVMRFLLMGGARGVNWAAGLLAASFPSLIWAPFVVFCWTLLLTFAGLKGWHIVVTAGIVGFCVFDGGVVLWRLGWENSLPFFGLGVLAGISGRFFKMA